MEIEKWTKLTSNSSISIGDNLSVNLHANNYSFTWLLQSKLAEIDDEILVNLNAFNVIIIKIKVNNKLVSLKMPSVGGLNNMLHSAVHFYFDLKLFYL